MHACSVQFAIASSFLIAMTSLFVKKPLTEKVKGFNNYLAGGAGGGGGGARCFGGAQLMLSATYIAASSIKLTILFFIRCCVYNSYNKNYSDLF
jgi:hypothetical protein